MKIPVISSMAIVTSCLARSRKLFMGAMGLPLRRREGDEYYFNESIGGRKHDFLSSLFDGVGATGCGR